jgi:hypothetical protein
LAYVSTIQEDWHAEAFRRGNAYQIVVNIGHDEATNCTYSIALGLEPQPGGAMEYYFCIIVYNGNTDEETSCFSGLESTNILPQVQRGAVLRAFLHATRLLLIQVNPANVNWCTWDQNLPEKALRKYLLIARVFESAGYRVESAAPHNGQYFWHAERLNEPGFPFDLDEGDGK